MSSSRSGRAFLYALLIFLGGALTGAFFAPRLGRTLMRPPGPQQMSRHMMDRLQSGLQLSEEQAGKIRPLLEKAASDLEKYRAETTHRVEKRITETNHEILSLLDPEQQKKFTKMEDEHRARMRQHHPFAESPAPPPPPPER